MQMKKEKLALSITSLSLGGFGLLFLAIPRDFFMPIAFLLIVSAFILAICALLINRQNVKNLALIAIAISATGLFTFGLFVADNSLNHTYNQGYEKGYEEGTDAADYDYEYYE